MQQDLYLMLLLLIAIAGSGLLMKYVWHTDIMAGLGYAGWSGGQLEDEIRRDVWLVTPYVHEAVFNSACEDRPQIAANAIGVDLNLIAPTPGHG